jgi:hypothetical protein
MEPPKEPPKPSKEPPKPPKLKEEQQPKRKGEQEQVPVNKVTVRMIRETLYLTEINP